ncbi:hypothetical protein fh0823_06750 [Francisella halioticida]|nr:hypothetical protein fh0823_06750 [Francisella halioticida]
MVVIIADKPLNGYIDAISEKHNPRTNTINAPIIHANSAAGPDILAANNGENNQPLPIMADIPIKLVEKIPSFLFIIIFFDYFKKV